MRSLYEWRVPQRDGSQLQSSVSQHLVHHSSNRSNYMHSTLLPNLRRIEVVEQGPSNADRWFPFSNCSPDNGSRLLNSRHAALHEAADHPRRSCVHIHICKTFCGGKRSSQRSGEPVMKPSLSASARILVEARWILECTDCFASMGSVTDQLLRWSSTFRLSDGPFVTSRSCGPRRMWRRKIRSSADCCKSAP